MDKDDYCMVCDLEIDDLGLCACLDDVDEYPYDDFGLVIR